MSPCVVPMDMDPLRILIIQTVVGPTHLKNMLVKLDHSQSRGEIKKLKQPPNYRALYSRSLGESNFYPTWNILSYYSQASEYSM